MVHFVFHGCNCTAEGVANGDLGQGGYFSKDYLDFAAEHNIIMVYPDSLCWGFLETVEDALMYTNEGVLPKTIMKMMERVS